MTTDTTRAFLHACIIFTFFFAALSFGILLSHVLNEEPTINGDMNHDNELTIKDLSILAAQINNK